MKIIDFDDENYTYYDYDEEEEKIKKEILYLIKKMKICCNKNNNSIKFYEFFFNNKKLILIMELLEHDLDRELMYRGDNGFNSEEICKIISQLNNTFRIFEKYKISHGNITLKHILLKHEDNQNQNFIVK